MRGVHALDAVRPSLRMLMGLPDKLLPRDVIEWRVRVRSVSDAQVKYRILRQLCLADLDIRVLRDARSRLAKGLPDPHQSSSKKLGFPVYEARDRTGEAWRGAVILHEGNPWMVYASVHDRFHSEAGSAMKALDRSNKLRPTSIDLRLKADEDRDAVDREHRIALLDALLAALQSAVTVRRDVDVDMSATRVPSASLTVGIDDIPAEGWDDHDAHTHADVVTLSLTLDTANAEDRRWVTSTCLPFLQPDEHQIESYCDSRLTSLVLLSRARLTQILVSHQQSGSTPRPVDRLAVPTVLHYADKFSITKAFVYGCAIRAVCGKWWVPAGSNESYPDLPICTECATELPAAQALKNLLRDSQA